MQKIWVQSLGKEYSLEEEMAICSSILMDRGAWCAAVQRVTKSQTWMSMPEHIGENSEREGNTRSPDLTLEKSGHETTDWFQIGKGVRQGCIVSPCLFNFYAEDIMRNAGLDEAQVGIKIARRNINNLRYADDTTPMAECEEELKSLLMKVKEESEKVGLNSTFRKLRSWHPVPSLHGKQMGKQWLTLFLGAPNHCRRWLQPWN